MVKAMFGRTPRTLLTILTLISALLAAGCQTTSPWSKSDTVSQEERQADRLARQGDYAGAAALYESAGAVARGEDRVSLLISAAANYLLAGNPNAADNVLKQTAAPSRDPLAARYRITMGELRLAQNRPQDAVGALGAAPSTRAPTQDRQRYYQVLASALGRLQQKAGEADALMRLHDLADSSERGPYQQQILSVVSGLSEPERGEVRRLGHPDAYGWIALANALSTAGTDAAARDQAFAQWRLDYPNHPASSRLDASYAAGGATPITWGGGASMGVLLPFTGPYQKAAEALREGIMAAFYALPEEQRPALRYYDTGTQSAINQLYEQAANEGAQLVIGPLTKEAVSALKQSGFFRVPVLALNHTDDIGLPPQGFYQFSLSPEEEGRVIAERASREGFNNAAILAPDTGAGDRYVESFTRNWQALGGYVTTVTPYNTEEHHLAGPVQAAANSGADFIYVVGKPLKSRQLRTQIQYFGRADAPVFLSGQAIQDMLPTTQNPDLNGARIPGMPWLLPPVEEGVDDGLQAARDGASAIEAGYGPFYAMGFDALHIALSLNQLTFGSFGIPGATGYLTLEGGTGMVHREPLWMTYSNGRPTSLPPPF